MTIPFIKNAEYLGFVIVHDNDFVHGNAGRDWVSGLWQRYSRYCILAGCVGELDRRRESAYCAELTPVKQSSTK